MTDAESLAAARRRVRFGLYANVAVFGVLSSLAWGVGMGAWNAVAISFVYPAMLAVQFTLTGDWDMSVASSLATLLPVVFVSLALFRPRSFLLVSLGHLSLMQYWFWSFMLLGIGV